MQLSDDVMLLMAKERAEEAMQIIAERRALRLGQATRQPLRVRVGGVLIRLGRRLMIRDPELSTGA